MVEEIRLINNNYNNGVPQSELTISMSRRDYVLQSVDWGTISSSRKTYKFITQVGVYVTGVTLETRPINIIGWVVGDTHEQLKQRKRFLNRFVSPMQKLLLRYNEYSIEGIPETTIRYGTTMQENNEVMCKFSIDLFCPDPLFSVYTPTVVSIAQWLPKLRFPLVSPVGKGLIMGVRSPSTIVNVNNPGTITSGMTVTFYAHGTVVNPRLVDINTQKKIQFLYTMSGGETLEVTTYDNKKGAKKILGESSEDAFALLDFESNSFIQLAQGDNPLRYDADSGIENLDVMIQFKPQYQEVQE